MSSAFIESGFRRTIQARSVALEVLEKSIGTFASDRLDWLGKCAELVFRPTELKRRLLSLPHLRQVIVSGTLENRVLLLQQEHGGWIAAHLAARPLKEVPWPESVSSGLLIKNLEDYVSSCEISRPVLFRLTRPRIHLISLCHPEVFPLPRFPLCISDLARAVRRSIQGEITLADMQLGHKLPDLLAEIATQQPDIIGISATFGQHDLLEELADGIIKMDSKVLLVFGGSLSALNAPRLLERYPCSIVARGAGEETICDIVEYWHGDRILSEVRGVQWLLNGKLHNSRVPSHSSSGGFLPELDLLEKILELGGVMQLESSRGCTHACSFCPREHKGVWAGDDAERMSTVLEAVGEIYDERSSIARKIFLVDEEFIGRDKESEGLQRAREVASELWSRGFRWETSSRVDQVYRPDLDRSWNIGRMRFWIWLREHGLDRCLFGIESGVDSILRRFNKRITARQNVLALRLLSACNIAIRCTYITFDHLMTISELRESYEFQEREDLILRPLDYVLPLEDLVDAVQDDSFAAEHSMGIPFYTQITYMLVSMECLIGSPYLLKVQEAGLAREELPSMGRRNALFLDSVIGLMSRCAQLWIDRSFRFDYLLKSLEKTSNGQERSSIKKIRLLLKKHAHRLLGDFLSLPGRSVNVSLDDFLDLMETNFDSLVSDVESFCKSISDSMRLDTSALLLSELQAWGASRSWELINK